MHILLVYQYYHSPDCAATGRHYSFVRHLGTRHRVSVISSDLWHGRRQSMAFPWQPPGVEVHMVRTRYDNRMSSTRRAAAYGGFALKAWWRGLQLDPPDVIWGSSTPLSAAWIAYRLARRLDRPWVFEVRDLWPDFPIQMGAIRSKPAQDILRGLEKRMYRSASRVVTLSEDMERHVIESGALPRRTGTIVNGTDLDLLDQIDPERMARLRADYALGDRRVVLYAGTLGRANAIPALIDAARRLEGRSDVVFVFAGDGYYRDAVGRLEREQSNVLLLAPQARTDALAWFKLADLSLVSFINLPVLAANSPAKLFDSLGAGTPVVVTNPGWTKALVEEHRCGWFVPPDDPSRLAARIATVIDRPVLLQDAGRRGEELAISRFDRRRLAEQMERVLMAATER